MTNAGRKKVVRAVLLAICMCLIFTGCWDRREIEEQASVIAAAVDQHDKGIQVTIQVPIPVKIVGGGGGGGGEGGQDAIQLFTASGQDLMDAFKNIQKQLNQDLSLSHMRLVVISEKMARNGLEDVIDALSRSNNVRRRLWPIIVEGEASKALEANPKMEQIPAQYMIDMIDNEVRRGRQFEVTLGRFLTEVADEAEQPLLNMFKVTEKTLNWTGTAIFDGEKMVGKLNDQKSWMLMQMRRDARAGYRVTGTCPGDTVEEVTFEPRDVKRTVTFNHRPLRFDIRVEVQGSIVENACDIDLSKRQNITAIEQQLAKLYENEARQVIKNVQQLKSDALQLGTEIRAFHPNLWETIDWNNRFPDADINVTYNVTVRGIGARYK